jgi:hypothetical protein
MVQRKSITAKLGAGNYFHATVRAQSIADTVSFNEACNSKAGSSSLLGGALVRYGARRRHRSMQKAIPCARAARTQIIARLI